MSFDPAGFVTITYPSAQMQDLAHTVDVISWTTAICLAVATWDWLSSFGNEYSRIWKREWSLISVLYIGARYWILISLSVNVWMYLSATHDMAYCEKWHRINIGINVPVEVFSGLILLVRTYAFTRQNRLVMLVLVTCYVAQVVFLCVCVKWGIALIPWFQIGQIRGVCFTGVSNNNLLVLGYFLTPLLYATVCMALTIHESLRSRNRLAAVRKSPVFHVFMREGAVYYLAMAVVVIVNIAFMAQQDASVRGCAYFFMPLIDASMSCRLVLSLRDADNVQFNSNVNVKSLWASGHFESGDEEDRMPPPRAGDKNETFAMAAVDSDGPNAPVQINIERVVHFSVDEEYAESEKKQ